MLAAMLRRMHRLRQEVGSLDVQRLWKGYTLTCRNRDDMMEQAEFRIPATGEAWRHYKGGLYTIVGLAIDDKGDATVVYTPFGWSLVQLPPLFTQTLGRFLQQVEIDKPRFYFQGARGGDKNCPFIPDGRTMSGADFAINNFSG